MENKGISGCGCLVIALIVIAGLILALLSPIGSHADGPAANGEKYTCRRITCATYDKPNGKVVGRVPFGTAIRIVAYPAKGWAKQSLNGWTADTYYRLRDLKYVGPL